MQGFAPERLLQAVGQIPFNLLPNHQRLHAEAGIKGLGRLNGLRGGLLTAHQFNQWE